MQTLEYRTQDKSEWGAGPWQEEPDKVQWPDPATGLPCLAVRAHVSGAWCGYVGVAEGHPLFGAHYGDGDLAVHGGLTFADFCMHGAAGAEAKAEATLVCHVPGPGEPARVWWFGFDCAHAWDLSPALRVALREIRERLGGPGYEHREEYRTLAYVREQCAELAQQLAEAAAA